MRLLHAVVRLSGRHVSTLRKEVLLELGQKPEEGTNEGRKEGRKEGRNRERERERKIDEDRVKHINIA